MTIDFFKQVPHELQAEILKWAFKTDTDGLC
jgi:hypothetical protein